jgi:hypothetical protein
LVQLVDDAEPARHAAAVMPTMSSNLAARVRMDHPVTVAIINSTPDAVELMRGLLFTAGFVVISTYTHDIRDGRVDFDAFIRQHRPRVIVYDIAPPYERNWRLFLHLRDMDVAAAAEFVVTSTNPARVGSLAGPDQRIYEIVEREEDMMRLVQAVKEASRARPVR